jgi:cytochrome c oxidase subunit 2
MILDSLVPAASTYAHEIDRLFDVITLLVGVPFLIANFLFFSFILRFRKKEGVRALYITGTEHQYMKWIHRAHVPILIFDVIIVVMAINVWYTVKQDLPVANSTIKVIAQQWAWTFVNPGPDNVLDTADDITTINELHVASDTLYHFKLESLDVLHDFSVPAFRLKQDAIPGRVITGWFEATRPGEYGIQCAEICGIGHGLMPAKLFVESPTQHAAWVTEHSPLAVGASEPGPRAVPVASDETRTRRLAGL